MLNHGTATLIHSTVSGNSAPVYGGGVENHGTMTLTNSTVSGNSGGYGGGVLNNGTVNLTHSTVSGNGSYRGGGVYNRNGTTILTNSTVSGNGASYRGGGVYNRGGLTVIEHSTLTGNAAPADRGGGVASLGDSVTLTRVRASLIAANSGTDVDFIFGGTNSFDSDGDNLIGDGNATGAFNQGGDQTGVANPGLGPLADNGGPTQTHAPMAGSLAIDLGPFDPRSRRPLGIRWRARRDRAVHRRRAPLPTPAGRGYPRQSSSARSRTYRREGVWIRADEVPSPVGPPGYLPAVGTSCAPTPVSRFDQADHPRRPAAQSSSLLAALASRDVSSRAAEVPIPVGPMTSPFSVAECGARAGAPRPDTACHMGRFR